MKNRQAGNGVIANNGINGSLRKREVTQPQQHTEYYLFSSQGNLKAYSDDVMSFAYYGYNAANTRTYKLSLYNTNLWINGQQQPLNMQLQNAMFYPNTYINFTQAGEYTKHYYNGTERICSRLGEQQIPISVENDQELLNYQHDTKEILRNAIGQHLYDEPTDMQEGEVLHLEYLQPCGNNNAVYYYHPNHLSSTMYVTDAQQSVAQSFLYAPYGEIISEYNTHAMGEAFPKYSFNAKELDEETGFYYYEARYYNPPTFISRDPLMNEKPWLSPYHYCSNNPVGRVDPSGMMDEDNIDKWRYNNDTRKLEWISDEGGNNHQIVEYVHNGTDGKLYYDKDKTKEYDGYIGDIFDFSVIHSKLPKVVSGSLDIIGGGVTFIAGASVATGLTTCTYGLGSAPATAIGTSICTFGVYQVGKGLETLSTLGYISYSKSEEQEIVKNICKINAYNIGSSLLSTAIGFACTTESLTRGKVVGNISMFLINLGWNSYEIYEVTHPKKRKQP